MSERALATALIVDDHPLFCDALSITLRAVAGVAQVETVDRLETALARLDLSPLPDVIVLDLNLPDVTGVDGLIRLKAAAGQVPVVVVSSLADNRVVSAAFQAGAVGFVPKHSRREVFRAAFDAIREGKSYLPEGYVPPAPEGGPATSREHAIARLALLTKQQAKIQQVRKEKEDKLRKEAADRELAIKNAYAEQERRKKAKEAKELKERTRSLKRKTNAEYRHLDPGCG